MFLKIPQYRKKTVLNRERTSILNTNSNIEIINIKSNIQYKNS